MTSDKRGRLVVVGTPIGNLEDLSPRGARALREADAILCEDTRVTAKLAQRFGLAAPRLSCPAPREKARAAELLLRLSEGQTVALVSDAGMPTLSDPGEHLVRTAADAGYPVLVVPGPSAPSAALAVSGLAPIPHTFLGFLPARSGERSRFLEAVRERRETLIWFEAPHRIAPSLRDAARVLGPRRAVAARELTKIHEEVLRGTLDELAALFEAKGAGRGEITVVVQGASGGQAGERALGDEVVDREIRAAIEGALSKRAAAREIAARSGRPAREIYARMVALAGNNSQI